MDRGSIKIYEMKEFCKTDPMMPFVDSQSIYNLVYSGGQSRVSKDQQKK
jgi:hypothetical protein